MMSSSIVIEKHMASFMQEFALIIPKKRKELEWVRNQSIAFDLDTWPESFITISGFREEFINIQCEGLLRNDFKKENFGQ